MNIKDTILREYYDAHFKDDGFGGKEFDDLTFKQKQRISETFGFKTFEVAYGCKKLKKNFSVQEDLNDLWNQGFKSGMISGVVTSFILSAVVYITYYLYNL